MSCSLPGIGTYIEVAVGRASLGSTAVSPHRLCALSSRLNLLKLSFFMERGFLVRFAEKNHGSSFKVLSSILGA